MRIRKYDFNWGRRELMKKASVGAAAGLLMPLSKVIADNKDLTKAYPDELLSVDEYTKGKLSVGDTITKDNVEHVKDLLSPIVYYQIMNLNRKIRIKKTVTDPSKWFPYAYRERMEENKKAGIHGVLDKNKNLTTNKGGPWKGGLPFPDAKDGIEAQYNLAESWGRHDYCQYAISEEDFGPNGALAYKYDFVWAELQVSGRGDGKVFHDHDDLLRYQTVYFSNTKDVAGTSFMSTWYSDQRKFPQLMGYLPQFRRTRTFPASQRFEPLIPGVTWFLSDAWAAGDPVLTWGDYKIKGRAPMLGAYNAEWYGDHDNWLAPTGGDHDLFYDYAFEMAPETMIQDSKPVKYPRAPVGYRRTWVDVRNGLFASTIRYDRNGKMWVSFEAGTGQYATPDGKKILDDGKGHPEWSWMYVHAYDVQRKRLSRIPHSEHCFGGYHSTFNNNNEKMYHKWFTQEAIQRLGAI